MQKSRTMLCHYIAFYALIICVNGHEATAQQGEAISRSLTVCNGHDDSVSDSITIDNGNEDALTRTLTLCKDNDDAVSRAFTVRNEERDVISREFTVGNCNTGACCIDADGCVEATVAECATVEGVFQGLCSRCPKQNIALIAEHGGIFVHVIGPPVDCFGGAPRGGDPDCSSVTTFIDAWHSPIDGQMCQQFGVPGSPAIPAGFFGPGSDVFTNPICLHGTPLGPTPYGDFGEADTLIQRNADPFDRCEIAFNSPQTVGLQVVALNLVNVLPIAISYNNGQTTEQWNVRVDLSEAPSPPGFLTAIKTHCNGGTYTSTIVVQARFSFTRIGSVPILTRVLDTGLNGIPPVTLTQSESQHWVSDLAEGLAITGDPCTAFHPGVEDTNPKTDCDCNNNGIRDACDLESNVSADCNADGVPDECQLAGRDCNENAIPDGCEDCNGNTIADECELDPSDPDGDGGVGLDCNNNGRPDECDVIGGLVADCNGNFIPDSCEFPGCPGLMAGDMSCDGLIDSRDLQPFVNTLLAENYTCSADLNQDGQITENDVDELVSVLIGE